VLDVSGRDVVLFLKRAAGRRDGGFSLDMSMTR
jgi:hypothetical protein